MQGRRGRRARAVWAWGGASLLHNRRSTMSALAVSHVYPLGSRLNERGRLEVGGCDVVELARRVRHAGLRLRRGRHARPRARLRRGIRARAATDFEVIFASKAFPCTAALPAVRRGGPLGCDVASGGELHLALRGGLRPRADLHARQQQVAGRARLRDRGRRRARSWSTPSTRSTARAAARPLAAGAAARDARHRADTHSYIQTGQVDSKFGFADGRRCRGRSTRCAAAGLELRGLHAHIGSQIFDARAVREARSRLLARARATLPLLNLGGGLGIAYTARGPSRRRSRTTWTQGCVRRRAPRT